VEVGLGGVPLARSGAVGSAVVTSSASRVGLAFLLSAAGALASACSGGRQPAGTLPGVAAPRLTTTEITALISPRVPERAAWAKAVGDALAANSIEPDPVAVCAVLAVIAQESGFREDPAVPGLARVVEERIEKHQARLGPLGRPVFRRLLGARAPADPRTFEERLQQVRTERDLDLVFRDLLAYYKSAHPGAFGAATLAGKLFDLESLTALNPITTAGPMQVSVEFAEAWARDHHGQPETVRDALYTREGGVYYGTARLFGHAAAYTQMMFRFADYNAGVYASRNAALQSQVARLTGRKLALDGDLLAYGRDGKPIDDDDKPTQTMSALRHFRDLYQPKLSDRRLRDDAHREKTQALESTDTYRAIKSVFAEELGVEPDYAVLPQVILDSPKLSRKRSTAWFAQAVDRRYQTCLASATAALTR
jgi:hypothetical protein